MRYCENCHSLFSDDEARVKEFHYTEEVWGATLPVVEREFFCPFCGSEHFEDAVKCDNCGEWFGPDELNEDGFCENCVKELKND